MGYFGDVKAVETDYGYDIKIRDDSLVRIVGNKIEVFTHYEGTSRIGNPSHNDMFDLGEIVNVMIGHKSVRHLVLRKDQLELHQFADAQMSNYDTGVYSYVNLFDVNIQETHESDDWPSVKNLVMENILRKNREELQTQMNHLYQGGANKICKVIRNGFLPMAGNTQ